MSVLAVLDYLSVFIFALTGALVASRAQLDLVGFVFIASLTAVGGGTGRIPWSHVADRLVGCRSRDR